MPARKNARILATMLAEAPSVKLCLSIILMISAGLSLALDFVPPSSEWLWCRLGFCRADQLHTAPSYKPAQPALTDLRLALRLDSANPYRWAEYGIALDERGDHPAAQPFFNRATELGAATPPVLMVAANHYLMDNQPDRALALGRRVLSLTADFDELLFATYGQLGRPLPDLLGTAIPAARRPAVAWLKWLLPRAPEPDLVATWRWLRERGFADDAVAGSLVQELWNRHSCRQGAQLWAEWLGPQRGDYLRPELLSNRRFAALPRPSPFDWTIEPAPSLVIARPDSRQWTFDGSKNPSYGLESSSDPSKNLSSGPQSTSAASQNLPYGLQLTFDGSENLSYGGLRQMAAVAPGLYRFSAVVESDRLTTNQGLSFHIFDSAVPARLNAATPIVLGTTPRHTVEVVFRVSAPVCGVVVQLERHPSEKFDNKIAGSFTIHEVSLRPLP